MWGVQYLLLFCCLDVGGGVCFVFLAFGDIPIRYCGLS